LDSRSAIPPETEQAGLLPCLCAQTRRVDRLLNRIYDEALRPLGINILQKSLLSNIARFPEGIDTAELSQRLALDRSTLTRNLKTLQQMGLVSTSQNQHDRRRRDVTLTDAGRTTVKASEPLWHEAQTRVVAALGFERAADMTDMLADAERIMRELES
jgi:DNA-binding MarR family transcriptional regulator